MKKSRFLLIIISAFLILAIGIAIGIVIGNPLNNEIQPTHNEQIAPVIDSSVESDDNPLKLGDYEKIVQEFTKLMEIKADETNVEAYLDLAHIYVYQKNDDKAIDILKKGYEKTKNEVLLDKIDQVERAEVSDSAGKKIKDKVFDAESLMGYVYYFYNEKGDLIRFEQYSTMGIFEGCIKYEYDNNSNNIKETSYYSDGSIPYYFTYEYDEKGNKIKRTHYEYNDDDIVVTSDTYEYDNNNNLIKETSYDYDGNIDRCITYEYDESYNLLKEETFTYFYSGSVRDHSITEYEYNERGNKIKQTRYQKETGSNSYTTYEYDINDNVIKEVSYDASDNADGSIYLYVIYEYDDSGNEIKRTGFRPDGSLSYTEELLENGYKKDTRFNSDGSIEGILEFNKSGNISKEVHYDNNGNFNYSRSFEFNKQGEQIKIMRHKSDGSVIPEYICEETEDFSKNSYYDSDGNIDRIYERDKKNNISTTITYNSDGTIKEHNVYEYKYDEYGNMTYIEYNENGDIIEVYTRFNNGYCEEMSYDPEDNMVIERINYRMSKKTKYNSDNTIDYYIVYKDDIATKYDANGNLIETIV